MKSSCLVHTMISMHLMVCTVKGILHYEKIHSSSCRVVYLMCSLNFNQLISHVIYAVNVSAAIILKIYVGEDEGSGNSCIMGKASVEAIFVPSP